MDLKIKPYMNWVLAFVSVLIVLIFSEIIVRLFVPVRAVGPVFSTYDPVYGRRLKKNFSAKLISPEFAMQFTTNSLGFRGPEPGPSALQSILFLGDSFTEGYGVNDGEEFPALVQKDINERYGKNRISVFNAGTGHSGNGHWVKFLSNEAKKYNPRLVVLQFLDNDFLDNVKDHLFNLTPDGELVELKVPPPSKQRIMQRIVMDIPGLHNSYLVGLIRQFLSSQKRTQDIQGLKSEDTSDKIITFEERLTFSLLEEVLTVCKHENWPVLGLIVAIEGRHLAGLERIFKLNHVPIIKIPGKIKYPDLYYHVDGHWNTSGHKFAAGLIVKKLIDLDILN